MYVGEDYPYPSAHSASPPDYYGHHVKQTGDCMHVPSGVSLPYTSSPHAMHDITSRRFRSIQDMMPCRRQKFDVSPPLGLAYRIHPTNVARRNERERNRVKHINSTFLTLRQHLPCSTKSRKLSKVDTLRSAIRYIQHLQTILTAHEECEIHKDSEQKDNDATTRVAQEDRSYEFPPSPTTSLSSSTADISEGPVHATSPHGSLESANTSHGSEGRAEPLSPMPYSPHSDTSSTLSGSIDGSTQPQDLSDVVEWFL